MRLKRDKKEKITSNYTKNAPKKPLVQHIKTSSVDEIPSTKIKHVYLNKILKKNLGPRSKLDEEIFQKNISNFQSSIQNILANEEIRQRAQNYVIQLRNKQGPLSPGNYPNDYQRIKNNNNLSRTNYDRFYDAKHKNIPYALPKYSKFQNNNDIGREIKREVINKKIVEHPDYSNYINNEQVTPERMIRVNKVAKYYDELPSFSQSEGNNIYLKNNLGNRTQTRGAFNYNNMNNIYEYSNKQKFVRNANTSYPLSCNRQRYTNNNNQNYYNNIYNDDNDYEEGYNENFDYNQIDTNSMSEK